MSPSVKLLTLVPSPNKLTATWDLSGSNYSNVSGGYFYVFDASAGVLTDIKLDGDQCSMETYELTGAYIVNGHGYTVRLYVNLDTPSSVPLESNPLKASPSGIPEPPTIIYVQHTYTANSTVSIKIKSKMNDNNGNSIDNAYFYICNNTTGDIDDASSNNIVDGFAEITVTDLPQNCIYSIHAYAINEAGRSLSSERKVLNLSTQPNAPTILSVKSLLDGQLIITFASNAISDLPNTRYTLLNGSAPFPEIVDLSVLQTNGDGNKVLTQNVNNGVMYNLSLKAYNDTYSKYGPVSNVMVGVAAKYPTLDGSGKLELIPIGEENSDLKYTFGTLSTTFPDVTYVASFYQNDVLVSQLSGYAVTGAVVTVTNISAFAADVFSVVVDLQANIPQGVAQALNLSGSDAVLKTFSADTQQQTWVVRPGQPIITDSFMTNLTDNNYETLIDGNSITLYVSAPLQNGGKDVTHYQFRLTSSDGTLIGDKQPKADYFILKHNDAATETQNWAINNPNSEYTVDVRASNNGGNLWGDWSAPVTKQYNNGDVMPAPETFLQPVLETLEYGDTTVSINLAWTQPTSGNVDYYELYRLEDNGSLPVLIFNRDNSLQFKDTVSTDPRQLRYTLRAIGSINNSHNVASSFLDRTVNVSYAPKILYTGVSLNTDNNSNLRFYVKRNNSDLISVVIIAVPDAEEEVSNMVVEPTIPVVSLDGNYYFDLDLGYKMAGESFIIVASNTRGTSYFDNISGKQSDRALPSAPAKAPVPAPAKAPAPSKTQVKK